MRKGGKVTSPNDGFSVLIPTYNLLPYLKGAIHSLQKNSRFDNEIIVCDDGSGDGTKEFLDNAWYARFAYGEPKIIHREHRGCLSGWNDAVKLASKEWLFIAQNDFWFLADWDAALWKWISEDAKHEFIFQPEAVEPFQGSFLNYPCGNSPEEFDEAKALSFMRSSHTWTSQPFLLSFAISREDWMETGGFNEAYDPFGSGVPDLQMRLDRIKRRRWVQVHDSYIYHFKARRDQLHEDKAEFQRRLFKETWGMTWDDSERFLTRNMKQG